MNKGVVQKAIASLQEIYDVIVKEATNEEDNYNRLEDKGSDEAEEANTNASALADAAGSIDEAISELKGIIE